MARDETVTAVVMHALPVGGGTVVLSALPGAGGDYRGDLDHLASLRPALVICITTEGELSARGAVALGADIQDKGARWVQLSVPSDGASLSDLNRQWQGVSQQARRALLGGGRVALLSPRGAGRCGMVLLRLMIEAGDAPDEALSHLRRSVPVALGSEAQMAWGMGARRAVVTFVRHRDP